MIFFVCSLMPGNTRSGVNVMIIMYFRRLWPVLGRKKRKNMFLMCFFLCSKNAIYYMMCCKFLTRWRCNSRTQDWLLVCLPETRRTCIFALHILSYFCNPTISVSSVEAYLETRLGGWGICRGVGSTDLRWSPSAELWKGLRVAFNGNKLLIWIILSMFM
jgi:hypothetical protein